MVSIIGTAGRREDGSKLTSEIFHRAIDKTKQVIKDKFKLSLEQVHLVSGGAAWMGMYKGTFMLKIGLTLSPVFLNLHTV